MIDIDFTKPVSGFSGILFIGDVHALGYRPGRRVDDYPRTCIDKLMQCVAIAKDRNLLPVCLGDLFHRANENNIVLISQMMDVAKALEVPMVVLAGSHDLTETSLTEYDALHILHQSKLMHVVDQSGLILTLEINGKKVALWGCPAGDQLPKSVSGSGYDTSIMITHHNIDFYGGLPKFIEPVEIPGCDMVVNGHLHHPAPAVVKGATVYHNPGSITRVSVDLKNAKPVVSVWTPAHKVNLESIPLVIKDNVFDLTGTEAHALSPSKLKDELPKGMKLSTFAQRMRESSSLNAGSTEDGAVLIEQLDKYITRFDKPGNLKRYLTGLLATAVKERHGVDIVTTAQK